MTDAVLFETTDDGIAMITLNRPNVLNAIDGSLLDGLDAACDELSTPGRYPAAVITGAGRGFCAGADLSGTGAEWTAPANSHFMQMYLAQIRLTDLLSRLYELPTPVVAAVNGPCVGGGFAIALHCDVRIASDAAKFGSLFIKAGYSSMDMGTSYLLPKIVGAGRARELMITGRVFDAIEAERIGLAHSVVPGDEVVGAALGKAREIAANNPYGVWQTKIGLNAALDAPSLRHAKEIENRTQIISGYTQNPRQAAMALREKRSPTWDAL